MSKKDKIPDSPATWAQDSTIQQCVGNLYNTHVKVVEGKVKGRSHWTLVSRDLKDKLLIMVSDASLKGQRAAIVQWAGKDEAKAVDWEVVRGTISKAYPGLFAQQNGPSSMNLDEDQELFVPESPPHTNGASSNGASSRPAKTQRTLSGLKRTLSTSPSPSRSPPIKGDSAYFDQVGLIATHLLHIGAQLEALVKIGNVLAGAAKNTKREKVLASLARVKAETAGSGSDSDEDEEEDGGKGKRKGGKGLAEEVKANTKSKAKKTGKASKDDAE